MYSIIHLCLSVFVCCVWLAFYPQQSDQTAMWFLALLANGLNLQPLSISRHCRLGHTVIPLMMAGELKGYFASNDVLLVERNDEHVAAFHEKERTRWREVYDEEYVEAPQEFYPGDVVEIVGEVKVKEIENARGMRGVVTHFEFDDGYESCQTCSSSCPVTVILTKPS